MTDLEKIAESFISYGLYDRLKPNFFEDTKAIAKSFLESPTIQIWKDKDGEWKGQEDKQGRVFGATHSARLVDIVEL